MRTTGTVSSRRWLQRATPRRSCLQARGRPHSPLLVFPLASRVWFFPPRFHNSSFVLPPRHVSSWFPPDTEDLDPEFLKDRASKLEEFATHLLHTLHASGPSCSADRTALLKFLVSGEQVALPSRQADFAELTQLLAAWKQPLPDPVWDKYVVALFGTTSAGKSSFVNYLFGFPLCRTSVCFSPHPPNPASSSHVMCVKCPQNRQDKLTLDSHLWRW